MPESSLWRRLQNMLHPRSPYTPDETTELRHDRIYHAYLREYGLSENDVLPQVEWEKVKPENSRALAHLAGQAISEGVRSSDAELLKLGSLLHSEILDKPNANRLVRSLLTQLRSELYDTGVQTPDVVVGIFPLSTFNGHCVVRGATPLILINNGALAMLECSGMILAAEKLRSQDGQVQLLLRLARQYCHNDAVVNSTEADHPGIWERIWTPMLISSAEEFLLAHELAHIALGHLDDSAEFSLPNKDGLAASVLGHSARQELVADGWAIMRLVDRCKTSKKRNALALDLAAAGPVIFLGTALLVEEIYRSEGITVTDYHPPASLRLYSAECLLEVLGLESALNVGRHFLVHVKAALQELGSSAYPPLLSRELNRIVCPVIESLGVDNERMAMIRDFQ